MNCNITTASVCNVVLQGCDSKAVLPVRYLWTHRSLVFLMLFFCITLTTASANRIVNKKTVCTAAPSFDEIRLSIVRNSTAAVYDQLTLLFNENASAAGTDNYDFAKFFNVNLSFYSISADNKNLSIDERTNTTQTIALGLVSGVLDSFSIRTDKYSFPDNVKIILIDNYSATSTTLNNGAVYSFAITTAAGSAAADRFSLQITYGPRYYFTAAAGSNNFNTLTNWSSKADGSGSHPLSLTAPNTVFYVQSNAELNNNMVLGTASEIIVGASDKAAVSLTIPDAQILQGKISITAAQSGTNTLVVAGVINALGTLHKTSTVNYLKGGQTIPAAGYGILKFSNNAGINTASGNIIVYDSLIVSGKGIFAIGNHQLSLYDAGVAAIVAAGAALDLSGSTANFNGASVVIASASDGNGFYTDAALITDSLSVISGATNVTVQRYLAQQQRGWRLLGHPLQSAVSFTDIAANSATPIDITYTNPSAKTYNIASNTWSGITDANTILPLMQGIALFIRGISGEGINADFPDYNITASSINNGNKPSPVTLSVKGSLNTAAPAAIPTANKYFYLVTNPYAAAISASAVLSASSNLSSVIALYNPALGASSPIIKAGGYEYYAIAGSPGGNNDVTIPLMGAFFVQDNGGGTIRIPPAAIVSSTNKAVSVPYTAYLPPVVKLRVENENHVTYDAVQILFDSAGTAAIGDKFDFKKLPNAILNISSISADDSLLAIDHRNMTTQTIRLSLITAATGNFNLKAERYQSIPADIQLELKDNYTHSIKRIGEDTVYPFTILSDSLSKGNNRFELVITKIAEMNCLPNDAAGINKFRVSSAYKGNALTLTIEGMEVSHAQCIMTDLAGKTIVEHFVENGVNIIPLSTLSSGVYVISIYERNTKHTLKVLIQ